MTYYISSYWIVPRPVKECERIMLGGRASNISWRFLRKWDGRDKVIPELRVLDGPVLHIDCCHCR